MVIASRAPSLEAALATVMESASSTAGMIRGKRLAAVSPTRPAQTALEAMKAMRSRPDLPASIETTTPPTVTSRNRMRSTAGAPPSRTGRATVKQSTVARAKSTMTATCSWKRSRAARAFRASEASVLTAVQAAPCAANWARPSRPQTSANGFSRAKKPPV